MATVKPPAPWVRTGDGQRWLADFRALIHEADQEIRRAVYLRRMRREWLFRQMVEQIKADLNGSS